MKTRLILLRAIAFAASLSLLGVPGMSLHGKDAKKAAKGNNKKGAAPTAASLVSDMKKSVAYIVKNAKDINPKSKQAVPFWSSLKTTIEGIDLMDAGIKAKSPDMIKGLNNTGRGVTELSATWGIIRGAHPKSTVGRGVKSLSSAYDMYLNHFGPSVAILKKGGKKGALTPDELAMIEKAGPQLESLLGGLTKAAATAKPKSYQSRMTQDLIALVQKLVAIKGNDRGTLAKYQYQSGRLQNALGAYGNIAKAYYPDYYKSSWTTILTPFVSTLGSLFGGNAYSYYDGWDYPSVSIANYGNYYEESSITSSISVSEESSFEASLEAYSEESATEEDADDEEQIDEEVADAEDDEGSLFEEVENDADDKDGDGIPDEDDDDDDNDGVADADDTDDDGDGVDDAEDADDADDEEEEEMDDDDDGVADCCEGCCE